MDKHLLHEMLSSFHALLVFEDNEADSLNQKFDNYTVQQHGNRQQKRKYNKNHNKNRNKNRGNGAYYNGNR